ncbi:MAG: DEAD/DEAH box helicase family protein [Caldilineaceae bacterium]|nr:DEAD/DEAH box helicase family protein [Caldilineaceae bacterium]
MSFLNLFAKIRPAYEIPGDNLVGEVLVPAMRVCDDLRIEVGFFSSRCLAQIAPGLASFINDTNSTLKLMVSPILEEKDQVAIQRGISDPQTVLNQTMERLFQEARISESAIERHTVDSLGYLVASDRLQIRVVLMERGVYHKKIWLLGFERQWLAVHGSGNATERGLLVNGEQMSIDRAWMDGEQSETRVGIFLEQWARRWNNQHPMSLTVEVGHALEILRGFTGLIPPTIADFWEAWYCDHKAGLEPELPQGYRPVRIDHRMKIPEALIWREGRFAHQGSAVDAIVENGGGILSMATGSGKTRAALIATAEIQDSRAGHLCVVVLVPTRPLIRQWAEDIRGFGIEPVVLSGKGKLRRQQELEQLTFAFSSIHSRTEVLVVSNSLFMRKDSEVRSWLESLPSTIYRLLIADEVHNLGARSFVDNLPDFFSRRIGLSATPIRQYDPDGTDQLFGFFGGAPLFDFSIGDAIKAGCLVPYRYHLHVARLDADEMDYYEDLTEQLVRAGFHVDDDGRTVGLSDRVARLLRDRRALVEQADAKLGLLESKLKSIGAESVSKTLIYTSAKPVVPGKTKQLIAVNEMLQHLNIISHQYTAEETGSRQSSKILALFDSGDYQVLTSMKVLDEGVDIPQTDTAFLLASSTVEREWVQRRGRILRNAPDKETANLHDFLVIPPELDSPSAKSLLRSELRRASAFADLAENEYDLDGPNQIIRKLEDSLWTA